MLFIEVKPIKYLSSEHFQGVSVQQSTSNSGDHYDSHLTFSLDVTPGCLAQYLAEFPDLLSSSIILQALTHLTSPKGHSGN